MAFIGYLIHTNQRAKGKTFPFWKVPRNLDFGITIERIGS